ncbi:Uncharacterised protein [uncultured archaeon]|nr:Uncharacterised protein [uncultured archaeon]
MNKKLDLIKKQIENMRDTVIAGKNETIGSKLAGKKGQFSTGFFRLTTNPSEYENR